MPILYDAIIAFLCCAGIIATFIALFQPGCKEDKGTCFVVSNDETKIREYLKVLTPVFKNVVVVTDVELKENNFDSVKVFSPEEFETYVTGNDKN